MSAENEANLREGNAARNGAHAGKWVVRAALLVAGALLGTCGYLLWNHAQEQQRLQQARQRAETLFRDLALPTDLKMRSLARQVEDLEGEVAQANFATASAGIQLNRYRVQQKRIQMQIEQLEPALKRLELFAERAPRQFQVRADREILSGTQREQLAGWQAQLEAVREDLDSVASEIDLAKARRVQLAATEAEASQRAQAELEATQRDQAEALERAQAVSLQLALAEASRQAQAEMRPTADDAGMMQRPEGLPAVPIPLRVFCLRPVVGLARAPLVIGSSYPDRFIGYRNWRRYSSGPVWLPAYFGGPPPWYW
jgi:hypothetical protein